MRKKSEVLFDGNYHCVGCGKVFRVDDRVDFIKHQRECVNKLPVLSDEKIDSICEEVGLDNGDWDEGGGYAPYSVARVLQQARQDTAERFQKAVKDLRDGKDLDLSEREFEIFFSIRNAGVSDSYNKGKIDTAREIIGKLKDRLRMTCNGQMEILFTQVDWQSLEDRFLKEEK